MARLVDRVTVVMGGWTLVVLLATVPPSAGVSGAGFALTVMGVAIAFLFGCHCGERLR